PRRGPRGAGRAEPAVPAGPAPDGYRLPPVPCGRPEPWRGRRLPPAHPPAATAAQASLDHRRDHERLRSSAAPPRGALMLPLSGPPPAHKERPAPTRAG